MTIGTRIKKARKYRGCTQKELGLKLGISQSAVGQFEKSSNITQSTLNKIAEALNLGLSYTKAGNPYFYDFFDTTIFSPQSRIAESFVEDQLMDLDSDEPFGMHADPSYYMPFKDLNVDEQNKLTLFFSKLNHEGKTEALKRMEELTLIEKYTK